MNSELLITNIGFAFSFMISLGAGTLVLTRRPEKNASTNIVFFLMCIAICIWQASYCIGINLTDPNLSRLAFMFNLSSLYIVIFNIHLILLVTDRFRSQKRLVIYFYALATLCVLYFIAFPDNFLLVSAPVMYLPNFFVPGIFYEVQDGLFFSMFIFLLFQFYASYIKSDYNVRRRLNYFIVAFLFMYTTSLVPEFLLYGIHIDPLISCISGLCIVPMTYAIIKYDVISLNILAKRALGYALSIAGVTLLIFLIGYLNVYVVNILPDFPQWFFPLLSSIITVTVGVIVWREIKEVDVLKYQFVEVATHKFRTPLTYIRWSLDTLRGGEMTEDEREKSYSIIQKADEHLFELTDMLLGLSNSDESGFLYKYLPERISDIVGKAMSAAAEPMRERQISVNMDIPDDMPKILADHIKLEFAVQMILENATVYSPKGGKIEVSARSKKGFVILSIKDFGMGIPKEDIPKLFSKFWRSSEAMKMHTEGLGIGLYLTEDIVRRHGGNLWAESAGPGTGTTFFFRLPIAKKQN